MVNAMLAKCGLCLLIGSVDEKENQMLEVDDDMVAAIQVRKSNLNASRLRGRAQGLWWPSLVKFTPKMTFKRDVVDWEGRFGYLVASIQV
jgi:hypothetical protein